MKEINTTQAMISKGPKTISMTAKLVGCISLLSLGVGTWISSPKATLLLPVLFAPTCLVVYYYTTLPARERSAGNAECLFWVYIITGTIGLVILIAIQSALAYILAYLLFGNRVDWFMKEFQNLPVDSSIVDVDNKAARAEAATQGSYWAFIFLMSFVLAGFCEDYLKYLAISLAKKYRGGSLGSYHEYLVYGSIGALSFSTVENILFVLAACQSGEAGRKLATTMFERLVAGTTGHMLGGISIALGVIRRDEKKENIGTATILARSVIIHGLWDFSLMSISALNGNLGWVHPENRLGLVSCYAIVMGLMATLVFLMRPDLRKLKME